MGECWLDRNQYRLLGPSSWSGYEPCLGVEKRSAIRSRDLEVKIGSCNSVLRRQEEEVEVESRALIVVEMAEMGSLEVMMSVIA